MLKNKLTLLLVFCTFLNVNAEVVNDETGSNEVSEQNRKIEQELENESLNLHSTQEALFKAKPSSNSLHIDYNASESPRIILRIFTITTIDLPERIVDVIIGDKVAFWASPSPKDNTRLLVKAIYAGADTNVQVYGESGNIYNFVLKSIDTKSHEISHMLVYVKDKSLGVRSKHFQIDNDKEKWKFAQNRYDFLPDGTDSNKRNTAYEIFASPGSEEVAPVAVYDNGEFTMFDYRKPHFMGRYPVIYRVMDSMDNLVNREHVDGFIVVKAISNEGWTIRHGDKVVCVKRKKKWIR
ncbi:MAG: TrbG/VirB9 family P-type conjugative transfer protein [Sphingobacteriia bacterium]|nr:TrbG/VirB9 family P-type conjugative transfer protein [Sphingobacteriia bacterium]